MKAKRRFKWKLFGRDVSHMRGNQRLGLREAARNLGIHPATFCRAEQGKPVEVADFIFLCAWMSIDPTCYLYTNPNRPSCTYPHSSLEKRTDGPIGCKRKQPYRTFEAPTYCECGTRDDCPCPLQPTDEKTLRNFRVQARYDDLMRGGKHGHYETIFRVVREEVDRLTASPPAPTEAAIEGAINASDPKIIIAGIRQFGLAPDGADLRDLEAAIDALWRADAPIT